MELRWYQEGEDLSAGWVIMLWFIWMGLWCCLESFGCFLFLLCCQSLCLGLGGLGLAFLCSLVWVLWRDWGCRCLVSFVFSGLCVGWCVCQGFVSGGVSVRVLCRVVCESSLLCLVFFFSFVGS